MKPYNELDTSILAKGLIRSINRHATKKSRFMEFCGGHTHAIMKNGIRQLLPEMIELTSGPGCPVCVTDNAELDKAIELSKLPDTILATFGDMVRVPGSYSNLQENRAAGRDIRIVYSALDALEMARSNPGKSIIFIAAGFETTAPGFAASVLQAEKENLKNYFIFSMLKICPPVIKALLDSGETNIQGLICPGHVSAVIGSQPWEFIASDYGIPCVVAGFEPLDILQSIEMLAKQTNCSQAKVEIAYKRGVTPQGNSNAINIIHQVFNTAPGKWRGIGEVADSGLKLKPQYKRFDAEAIFKITPAPTRQQKGCICGEILRGVKSPTDCGLFGSVCTPVNPVGPCMVSSEGSCSAFYLYGGNHER